MWINERSEEGDRPRPELPDEAWLRGEVEALAVPRNLWAEARSNQRVGARVGHTLESLGYRVHEQGRYRNVVALPRGASGPLTLVCAHFDSVAGTPGADDNASGVAAMLAAARTLASIGRDDVGFVAFNAEEDGLLGSRDFVARGLDALGIEAGLVHVLEMVGFCARAPASQRSPLPRWVPTPTVGDFVGLMGNGRSNRVVSEALRARHGGAPRRLGLRTWGPVHRWLPDLGRSDHLPFWGAKIPAVLWTDTANFRNPHYHLPSDRPDTLDYGFLRRVTSMLVDSVTPLSSASQGNGV